MTTVLHIKSSSNLTSAASRSVGDAAHARLAAQGAAITVRDLATTPVPHIDPAFLGALFSGQPDPAELALSDTLLGEVMDSDVLLIEAPMYNFGIPSVLKAWIDHVARAGKAFRYTADGPQGLLGGKKAILVLSSGGIYSEGPAQALDHQESYLRAIMNFFGITDVQTIRIEGMALGADKASAALKQAQEKASALSLAA